MHIFKYSKKQKERKKTTLTTPCKTTASTTMIIPVVYRGNDSFFSYQVNVASARLSRQPRGLGDDLKNRAISVASEKTPQIASAEAIYLMKRIPEH